MIAEKKLKVLDCTIVVSADSSKITVSRGSCLAPGHETPLVLDDDVEYDLPTDTEERNIVGHLVLDKATGQLDVYVEELWRDARRLVHDWRFDTDREKVATLFDARVYPDKEPFLLLWNVPKEGA